MSKTPLQLINDAEQHLIQSNDKLAAYSPYNDYHAQSLENESLAKQHHWQPPPSEGLSTALINVGLEIGYRPIVEYQYAHDKRLYVASHLEFEMVKTQQSAPVAQAMNSIENFAAEHFKNSDNFHENMNKVRAELVRQANSGELYNIVRDVPKSPAPVEEYAQANGYAVVVNDNAAESNYEP